ncbi:MAG: serine/threonine-protein kinase [Pseudonocardiaceae bacterium]
MGGFVTLVGTVLSLLHGIAGPSVCPGDWVWTVTAAGVLLAVPPVLAAAVIALVRRVRGNRYSGATVLLFALLGITGTGVIPLLGFTGIATTLHRAALGIGSSGLTRREVTTLHDAYCFLPPQAGYLGGGRSVSDALTELPGPDWLLAGRAVVLLVAAPALALLLTWILARLAVRRGPAWPALLLWVPFLGLLAGTLRLNEGVVGQLWVGYIAGIVPGLFLLLLIGRPGWSVVRRSEALSQPPPEQASSRQQPVLAEPPIPQERPVPPPPRPAPTRALPPQVPGLPPTRQVPGVPSSAAPLAADPGRLPPTLAARVPGAGVALPPNSRDRAGDSRFRRLRQLGEGGFGDVWLAMDSALDREVAIKVARAPDPDTERRIRREARALAAVDHPHCVRVYDILSGIDDLPGLAIVMEYLPGPSLAQQVGGQGLLSDTAGAHLWSTLAGALAAAHDRGVLHRDVKPSNVIIDDAGRAHLIDFGIARTARDPTMTATGIVIGTPDFLSPEVAAGGVADPRTDSWQLAATVSYALCGHPPRGYRDSPVAALQAAADREPATRLPERSAHRGLLHRALHPDPRQRPTLAEVHAGLTGWLARTGRPAEGPVTRMLAVPPHT